MGTASTRAPGRADDISWGEFAELAKVYLRIPLILVAVEVVYRLITLPRDALAWVQVVEAWLWHHGNLLFYGSGSSTLGHHEGWQTKVTLFHPDFPIDAGSAPQIALYVSDECAGIHEIVFFAALVLLTPGITQRTKWISIAIMAVVIFILNMVRLWVLFPIAEASCGESPNSLLCDGGMWDFHHFVLEWGALMFLMVSWAVWFVVVGGPKRLGETSDDLQHERRLTLRWPLPAWSWGGLGLAAVLVAVILATTDFSEAASVREEVIECDAEGRWSPSCETAGDRWDELTSRSWSLGMLATVALAASVVTIERTRDEDGADDDAGAEDAGVEDADAAAAAAGAADSTSDADAADGEPDRGAEDSSADEAAADAATDAPATTDDDGDAATTPSDGP